MTTEREIGYYILDRDVVAVAIQGSLGTDWAAYIGATFRTIDSEGHTIDPVRVTQEEAARIIVKTGTKLRYDIAKVLFPKFARKYTWRQ